MEGHYRELYKLYREIRGELILIFDQMSMDRFGDGFHISQTELRAVVSAENVMDLSVLFHDAFLCRNYGITESAYHIIDRTVITDDSPKDEICMYFNAHLYLTVLDSLSLFDDFIQKVIAVSQYYTSYLHGHTKDFFDYVAMEDMMESLSLS